MQLYVPTATFGATNMVVSKVACKLVRLRVNGGGVDRWLQIHDAAALPANTAVPIESILLPAGIPTFVDYALSPLSLATGLVLAVSDTETTLTLSATTADFMPELEAGELFPQGYPSGTTTTGDLSTGVDSLQVWTDAQGPRTLYRVHYVNNDNAVRYLMLFVRDAYGNGDTPVQSWKVAALGTLVLTFGPDGYVPQIRRLGLPNVVYDGCFLAQSSTAETLTVTASAASFIKTISKS